MDAKTQELTIIAAMLVELADESTDAIAVATALRTIEQAVHTLGILHLKRTGIDHNEYVDRLVYDNGELMPAIAAQGRTLLDKSEPRYRSAPEHPKAPVTLDTHTGRFILLPDNELAEKTAQLLNDGADPEHWTLWHEAAEGEK